ncbi:hypothetical protein FHS21_003746 [Phyllobacterium trifolii]|jgi:hypothetical protein|uniref:DUF4124 domain-containing protein n=1 Tax=Phyllobacterium trifolii TaxID=300193 RepID=A0A839UEP9_9HYPH|nr:hypothetical protein [Phyllobacterium trifolii]MBB3147330.1 hypothetical protein [Phyllobacterium trifolii]
MSIKPLVFITVIGLSSLPLTAYAEGYFYEYDPSGGIPFTDRAPDHLDIHDNGGYGDHNFLSFGQQGKTPSATAVIKTSARHRVSTSPKQK